MAEKNNQQPNPGEEYALTPRIEVRNEEGWYTNLYDLEASVAYEENAKEIEFQVRTILKNRDKNEHPENGHNYNLSYLISEESVTIQAETEEAIQDSSNEELIIPVVSPSGEKVVIVSPIHIEIEKPDGVVVVKSNLPMQIKNTEKGRIFNMVPGVEVVPISIAFKKGIDIVTCSISVK
jgi:hypothetical protein